MKVFQIEQRSDEWHNLRRGVITGTKLEKLMVKDNQLLVDKIVAELYSDEKEEFFINEKMQRGIDMEYVAKIHYSEQTFSEIFEVGFCLSSRWHFLGLSPDGFVGSNGAIEIKCPDTSTHVKYIRENSLPKDYLWQVVNYFLVNEDLEWLDFVSFDDRFTLKPLHIIRINRLDIQDRINEATYKLDFFWEKVETLIAKIK